MKYIFFAILAAGHAIAFPWVSNMPGVDNSKLDRRTVERNIHKRASCPFNSDHTGAAAYNSDYPYTGAQDGLAGTQVGGVQVPAPGDTAHEFEAPGDNDIRGPCPGLNTAANHHFLSHDGVTTFTELVDAQQNLYNVGYDLAVVLAVLGVGFDGDVLTGKLSIGCDATSRTSATGDLLGDELGLDGHNKFEADTSLTRDDYYLADGDDYTYNASLFAEMTESTGGVYDLAGLAEYRYQRYQESLNTNPEFYFGPKSLLLFGAASFLYELMPGSSNSPDLATVGSFFGAGSADDGYAFTNEEKIPDNWYNRVSPYTLTDVALQIVEMYALHPVLFGGNVAVGNFDALDSFGDITNGTLDISVNSTLCLIYQLATEDVPTSLSTVLELPLDVVEWITGKIDSTFEDYGCAVTTT